MAIVGYVSLDEANAYITQNFVTTDPIRLNWEDLSDADKSALLSRSWKAVDTLPFPGRKTSEDQPTAFPRYPSEVVPQAIKDAQVENAVEIHNASLSTEVDTYKHMWQWGIKSYSIGSLSETFAETAGTNILATDYGVLSLTAQRLLRPFLGGGFCIEHNDKIFKTRMPIRSCYPWSRW